MPIEVFISYASEDEPYLKDLMKHLQPSESRKEIQTWSNADITAGTEWKEAIEKHLDTASVFLLLISAAFLASEYCSGIEMKRAVERHKDGTARVIPILVSPIARSEWKAASFSALPVLPKGANPIEKWLSRDEAYASVVDSIHQAIKELTIQQQPITSIISPAKPPEVEPSVPRQGKPIFTWRYLVLATLIVGVVLFALLRSCGPNNPFPPPITKSPTATSFDVYAGVLSSRFRVNTDTSYHRHSWFTDKNGMLTLLYPSNQVWGSMFITVGDVALPGHRGSLNLSTYKSLEIQMRADVNGQCVRLGIKDDAQRDNGGEVTLPQCLTTAWSTVKLSLDTFAPTDLHHLYVVFEVNFLGESSATVYVRTVRYSFSPVALAPFPSPTPSAPVAPPFNVYTDASAHGNHFVPSGFEGDYGAITMDEKWSQNPHNGQFCIQVIYDGSTPQNAAWAGAYWQDLPNNWGNALGPTGYNLSQMSQLTFWVRGEKEGQQLQFFVGGITGVYGDSLWPAVYAGTEATNYLITLTTSWQQVKIDLRGKGNLTHIIGGFGWSTDLIDNPQGITFYLDDIIYT